MQLNLLFLLHALSAALFGLVLLLVPGWFATQLGVPSADVTDIAVDFARLFSVCCFGIALLTWMTRASPSKYARRVVVISMFILELVGLVVAFTLHYTLAKYFTIFVFAIFTLAYLYILLFRQMDIEGP